MDRNGALPDRCVICNDTADGKRVAQKLYRSPLAWKLFAYPAPFVIAGLGVPRGVSRLARLTWRPS
jgi:hypothetical protein